MTPPLRGSNLPMGQVRTAPLPKNLEDLRGQSNLRTEFPTISLVQGLQGKDIRNTWLDTAEQIKGVDLSGTTGLCHITTVTKEGVEASHPAFLKVTHLLDPVRWMKGKQNEADQKKPPTKHVKGSAAWDKLHDPWNRAQIEVVGCYAFAKLREKDISPHFNHFQGNFCANAQIQKYNISDDFYSYRQARWFWDGKKSDLYTLKVEYEDEPNEVVPEEEVAEILHEEEDLQSDTDSEQDSEEDDDSEEESESGCEAEELEVDAIQQVETSSIHSIELSPIEEDSEEEGSSSSEEASDDETDEGPDQAIFAEIKDFPVMMMFMEKNTDTMDTLLENPESLPQERGTPEWESMWSAWLFQVIAALSVGQSLFGFTHNDLHTNNVVWSETDQPYLYQSNRAGQVWKVPTQGKIFRIIDFGRSIFRVNQTWQISDDFKEGNDAEGQQSFPPLVKDPEERVDPNPSFDLARLAVSLFEGLFPKPPPEIEDGAILSQEGSWIVRETGSALQNLLWKWLLDEDGKNILIDEDGSERFPDFDLQVHISKKCKNGIPSKQLTDPALDRFQIAPSEVQGTEKVYSLFC